MANKPRSPLARTPRPAKPTTKPTPADARGALSQMQTNRLPENMTSDAFEKLGA